MRENRPRTVQVQGTHNRVYMGGNLQEEKKRPENAEEYHFKLFDTNAQGFHTIFSDLSPIEFVDEFIQRLEGDDIAFELNNKEGQTRLTFTVEKERDDSGEEDAELPERCKIGVEIMRMSDDDDPTAVRFTRLSGSQWLFLEKFEELKYNLEGEE